MPAASGLALLRPSLGSPAGSRKFLRGTLPPRAPHKNFCPTAPQMPYLPRFLSPHGAWNHGRHAPNPETTRRQSRCRAALSADGRGGGWGARCGRCGGRSRPGSALWRVRGGWRGCSGGRSGPALERILCRLWRAVRSRRAPVAPIAQ